MRLPDRAYAPVHLDRIRENMELLTGRLTPGTKVIGIVKADGYGHGASQTAKAIEPFVCGYGVAAADEAVRLQEDGIKKWILVLGPVSPVRFEEMVNREIRLPVFRKEQAEKLSETAVRLGKTANIHLAVDTGMSRIGMEPNEASAGLALSISRLPGIEIEGIFTHFAKADERERETTERQLLKFKNFVTMLLERGLNIPVCHCSNSAGLMKFREADLNAVRAGIAMYGLHPSGETAETGLRLKPAMELKSFVTFIKEVPAGAEISYGGTYKAEAPMRIATVSIGYGDGYPRNLSGKGDVLICGKRAKILGRICMDQLMADVTGIPEAREGDVVTLLGRDGSEEITMEELAERSGGFHYEIPCTITKRVPRVYFEGGRPIAMSDVLL